jgi:nitroreductase
MEPRVAEVGGDVRLTPVWRVLDRARWAPSGDNTQPWRFELVSPTEAVIHTFDTRHECVYDLSGGPSQIAVGAMLETARIAASALGWRAHVTRLPTESEERLQFRLTLAEDGGAQPSALADCIESRCTNRRPYSGRPLTREQKTALEASVGAPYTVVWLEGPRRRAVAKLLFGSAWIRLRIREAYDVHASIIEWRTQTSETGVPDQAIGLDPVGLALMRWAMKSWERTRFLSTYLGGTLLPRLQLELLPALGCAAHALIVAEAPPRGVDAHLRAGAAVQRFWLTAERLGLSHQPEMTPLIFAAYHREGRRFAAYEPALRRAAWVDRRLRALVGGEIAENAVWMGRVGVGQRPAARSVRRPLQSLIVDSTDRGGPAGALTQAGPA